MTDEEKEHEEIEEPEESAQPEKAAGTEEVVPESDGEGDKPVEPMAKRPTRRRFLKFMAWVGGFFAALASLPAIPYFRAKYPKSPIALKTFSDKEFHILKQAARTIIPRGGAIKLGAEDVEPEIFIDEYFSDFPGLAKKGIKALLIIIEHAPLIFEGDWKTFSNLGDEDRENYLRGWEESESLTRRKIFEYLKGIICIGFYSNPKVLEEIGYEYPC